MAGKSRDIFPPGREVREDGIPVRYVRDPAFCDGKWWDPDVDKKMWRHRENGTLIGALKESLRGGRGERWYKVEGLQIEGVDPDVLPHSRYADALMRTETFLTLSDTDELYVYRDGVYRPDGEAKARSWLEGHVRTLEKSSPKSHLVNEVLAAIRRRTYGSRDSLNPPGKLCLRNGILELDTLDLGPHTPDVRFTFQLPVAFDPTARCPRFERAIVEVLPDPEERVKVQMLFGYVLEPGNPYQVAFMLYGPGNNGKSTVILGVLKDLLGSDAIATETLQSLSDIRFATASLFGKLANLCADIPAKPVRYTGVFKEATGGDPMRGEWKFQRQFSFTNPAKLIFSCNELPEVSDRTKAFWRRWLIINFTVDFTGREDRGLAKTLRGELPGILNWSLEGLRMLRASGGFPVDGSGEGLMKEWKQRSDSLYWFVSECVETDPEGQVRKDAFYQEYAEFAESRSVRVKTREIVGKELPSLVPSVRTERQRIDDTSVRVWAGVRFKKTEESVDQAKESATQSKLHGALGTEAGGEFLTGVEKHGAPGAPGTETPAVPGYPGYPGVSIPAENPNRDQNPDFMLGLKHALEHRRLDSKRPVEWVVQDVLKELRGKGRKPDAARVRAGVERGMKGATP